MYTKKLFKFPIKDIIVPIFKQHQRKTYKIDFSRHCRNNIQAMGVDGVY